MVILPSVSRAIIIMYMAFVTVNIVGIAVSLLFVFLTVSEVGPAVLVPVVNALVVDVVFVLVLIGFSVI